MPSLGSIFGAAKAGMGTLGSLARSGVSAAWGNPYGRSAMIGAGIGAVYGAMSDNTSVMGGMAKGAVLGAGVAGGVRGAFALRNMARRSAGNIGPKMLSNGGYNPIRGLLGSGGKQRVMGAPAGGWGPRQSVSLRGVPGPVKGGQRGPFYPSGQLAPGSSSMTSKQIAEARAYFGS
jgi:hypothetical protein